jgi:hypothetical protein
MTVDEIRAAYYAKPFKPFVVRLTDGRKLKVPKQHYLGISPVGDEIVVARDDSFVFVKIDNVASLEITKAKRRKRSA